MRHTDNIKQKEASGGTVTGKKSVKAELPKYKGEILGIKLYSHPGMGNLVFMGCDFGQPVIFGIDNNQY
jgi:hypothetical protein